MYRVVVSVLVACLILTGCAGEATPDTNEVGQGVAQTPTVQAPTMAPAPTDTLPSTATPTPRPPTSAPTPTPATATPSPPSATATPKTVTVKSAANVRSGPGTDYAIVGKAAQGDPVQIIARNASGDWLQVALASSTTGWMAAFLIDDVPDNIPVAEVVPPSPTPAPSTATPTPVVSAPAGGKIVIVKVYNKGKVEYVEIANQGDAAVDVSGWHVYGSKDDDRLIDDYFFPPGFTLQAGQIVRLHSGEGGTDNDSLDIHWTDKPVWNNKGETVYLKDAAGNLMAEYSY